MPCDARLRRPSSTTSFTTFYLHSTQNEKLRTNLRENFNDTSNRNSNLNLLSRKRESSRQKEYSTLQRLEIMSDSDGEYVADNNSDDDFGAHQVSSRHGTRSTGPVRGPAGSTTRGGDTNAGTSRRRAKWEDIQRSWDNVIEGADGSINTAVENLREATKRKRCLLPICSKPRKALTFCS